MDYIILVVDDQSDEIYGSIIKRDGLR